MSSLLFTALDKDSNPKSSDSSFITWALAGLWVLLIAFGLISLANPQWLQELSDPGRKTEAIQMNEKGDIFLLEGKHNQAISLYMNALQIKPDLVSARVNMAIAYSQMGMFAEAERTFKEGLKLNPKKEYVIQYNLASMYSDMGDTSNALKMYYQNMKSAPYPYFTYREIASIYYNQQDWQTSIYYFQKALENRLTMQNAYSGMLKEELHSWPDDPDIQESIKKEIERGITPQRIAAYDTTVFNQVLNSDQSISKIHNYIGYSHAVIGNLNIAISYFRNALNVWPSNLNAKLNLDKALQTRQMLNNKNEENL